MARCHVLRIAGLMLIGLVAVVAEATDVQPAVGHRAPDFTLRDPDGHPVQLSRVVRERAVLLNFWATWCRPVATPGEWGNPRLPAWEAMDQ